MDRNRSRSPRRDRDSKYERSRRYERRRSYSRERKDIRDRNGDDYRYKRNLSKERYRDRDRSRIREREIIDRDRLRGEKNDRHRRHDSRDRRRSRSHSREKKSLDGGAVPKFLLKRTEFTEKDLEGKSHEEIEMMKLMGFGNFSTTKGSAVAGNDVSAVHLAQKRKYRQYMNRKGGFNRPLDFVA